MAKFLTKGNYIIKIKMARKDKNKEEIIEEQVVSKCLLQLLLYQSTSIHVDNGQINTGHNDKTIDITMSLISYISPFYSANSCPHTGHKCII